MGDGAGRGDSPRVAEAAEKGVLAIDGTIVGRAAGDPGAGEGKTPAAHPVDIVNNRETAPNRSNHVLLSSIRRRHVVAGGVSMRRAV